MPTFSPDYEAIAFRFLRLHGLEQFREVYGDANALLRSWEDRGLVHPRTGRIKRS